MLPVQEDGLVVGCGGCLSICRQGTFCLRDWRVVRLGRKVYRDGHWRSEDLFVGYTKMTFFYDSRYGSWRPV